MKEIQNRRQYFRHDFSIPLCTEMRIIKIGTKNVETSKTLVCVKNISAGGLLFETNLNIPVRADVTFEFTMTVCHKELILPGMIKRRHDLAQQQYQYGVEFLLSEQEKSNLVSMFNEMSVKLHKKGNAGCSLCSTDRKGCYKIKQKKQVKI
ncbi:PilZ domain-containing protein [Anoxybacillus vitaminiphilus]|uniref:PilZ domain-containing protein n=1 Tax=Paranoxybacillus vitaminiphilus TaxID=581036 RepID=A0A327YMF3_9BACL|nr:PilZ domain-containing protein [Anoxybacillus vitaminiphilus]RAK19429.1 PilZ domain-containing protein [Anoxybacillus vitaminiphilus]